MKDPDYDSYRIEAPEELAEVVTHFYVARNHTPEPVIKRLVPSFQTIMIFSFGNAARLLTDANVELEAAKCLVLGPVKKGFSYSVPAGGELWVINFKEDAFYRLFGSIDAAHPVNPDALFTENCFETLWQQLAALKTDEKRIHYLQIFCQAYVKEKTALAAELIHIQNEAQDAIKTVAANMALSERTIQKEYKKQFGFTAKEKNRYQRFLKTMQYLQALARPVDWQELAYRFNYYDQSHLIRDFQFYMSISPKQYLRFQQDICMGAA